jgi:leader peptidase (prepilin peptidase)/N-methyltransferase
MAVAWRFGPTWQTVAGCLLTYTLITQSIIDLKHTIIPDEITIPILWVGILINYNNIFVDLNTSVLGAVFGYLSLWIIYWIFYLITKKEGMGYGDFKLLAMLGAWLGWQMLPFIILFSSLVGSLAGISLILSQKIKMRNKRIPFGPFLAIAGWIALIMGSKINAWYASYAGIL